MFFKKIKSPLEQAIATGSLDEIQRLAEQPADLEVALSSGKTPLFYAIYVGRTDLVKFLVSRGVDLERRNSKNHTPLYSAVRLGRVEITQELLAAKANANVACGPQGQTPLFSVMEGYDGHLFTDVTILRRIVSLLIANGADPAHRLTSGITLAHGAAVCDDVDLLDLLLEKQLDVNALANSSPPITISVRQGKAAMVARFIEAGARTDIRFPNGMTLLAFANQRGDRQVLEALQGKIQQIAKPEVKNQASSEQTDTNGKVLVEYQPAKTHTPPASGSEFDAARRVTEERSEGPKPSPLPTRRQQFDQPSASKLLEQCPHCLANVMFVSDICPNCQNDRDKPPRPGFIEAKEQAKLMKSYKTTMKTNTRDFNFWYTVILTLIVGIVTIVVAYYNWSDFKTLGHTICSIVAGCALYVSVTFLIEGFYPTVGDFKCPRCGGAVGRSELFRADESDPSQALFHMTLFSLLNVFATFHCAKCGPIRGSEFPLMPRIIGLMRSLRWLALGTLALGAIVGVIVLVSLSSHH
jgi:hypothetical protein